MVFCVGKWRFASLSDIRYTRMHTGYLIKIIISGSFFCISFYVQNGALKNRVWRLNLYSAVDFLYSSISWRISECSSRNQSLTSMQRKQSNKNEYLILLYYFNSIASNCFPFIKDPPAVCNHPRPRTRQAWLLAYGRSQKCIPWKREIILGNAAGNVVITKSCGMGGSSTWASHV